jgi:glutamyl-tRNA reductase
MTLLLTGISHKTAPVTLRERYAFPDSDPSAPLRQLHVNGALDECLVLSTCNRVEVLAAAGDQEKGEQALRAWMAEAHGQTLDMVDRYLYVYREEEAVQHVFRVASSLDSMIVGEPQILGQMKDAYRAAARVGTAGPLMNRLMQRTFSVAKRVRTETGVAQASVSVASVAVQLARRIFDELSDKRVVLLGAGEMIKTAARYLKSYGAVSLLVLNRTLERAEKLAGEVGGEAGSLDSLSRALPGADIVLSSLGDSPGLVTAALVRQALRERNNRPMFLIDIALPRNVEPAVNDLDGVYLYNLDDLAGLADINAREREAEARRAEELVLEEARDFVKWLATLDCVPTIARLTAWGDGIRDAELKKALASLGEISDENRQVIEGLSNAIVRKLLHRPVTRLKKESEKGSGKGVLVLVKDLFDLDDEA